MKRAFQILALLVALVTVGIWLAKGANTGWTRNQMQLKTLDPVTGIEQVEWEDKFIPGLDFLGFGLATAGVLTVVSLFIRKQTKPQQM